jgi:hypothetical protein
MADEQSDPPDATANAAARRRKPPTPTIDLAATEIETNTSAKPSDPAPDSVETPASEALAAPQSRRAPWAPSSMNWPVLLGAGALGGGLGLLVLAMLWWAGVFSPPDGAGPANARLALMESRLREISRPVPATMDAKAMEDLAARLGKLEAAAAAPPPAGDSAVAGRLAALEAAVKSLQVTIAELNRRADDQASAVRESRSRADAALAAADAARSTPRDLEAVTNRIAALENTFKTFPDDLAKHLAAVGDRPLRLAVAAQALRIAVDRGDPFASELAAVKPLSPDPRAITQLEPFAATGVPTPAALARQLTEITPAMSRLAGPLPPEGGFFDRLQANAERLVRVRPIEEGQGDDPAAVISRIEAKAARADIAGALAELTKLPAPVRAPAEDWIKKAQARTAAVDASRRLAADAFAALGRPAP